MSSLLPLNPDDKKVLLKALEKINIALFSLKQHTENDSLSVQDSHHTLQYVEHSFSTIKKVLAFDCQEIKSEIEFNPLDVLKEELSAYKKIVRENSDISKLPETMLGFVNNVKSWWEEVGFHHVDSINMDQYGMIRMTLGFHVDFIDSLSLTPESDQKRNQENYERLVDKGIIFLNTQRRSRFVKDCDQTRNVLSQIVAETFDGATVFSFESKSLHNQEGFLLKQMIVHVRNPSAFQLDKKSRVNENE